MIKLSSVANAWIFGCLLLSGEAMAACTGSSLNQSQLGLALSGNTVCAIRNSDRWQELHQAGGALIDYKRGAGDPVDPSETVGNWSIAGNGTNATVVYNYGSGGTFTFQVYLNSGNSYSFCVGLTDLPVTIKNGGGACP